MSRANHHSSEMSGKNGQLKLEPLDGKKWSVHKLCTVEISEAYENIVQLKLESTDGKMRW